MKINVTLLVDAAINYFLGLVLLFHSPVVAACFGIPPALTGFYPNILGAVLFGIGIALTVEAVKKEGQSHTGLGLMGAVCINLSGGLVLMLWLIFGGLAIPMKGMVILWVLALVLVGISTVEILNTLKKKNRY